MSAIMDCAAVDFESTQHPDGGRKKLYYRGKKPADLGDADTDDDSDDAAATDATVDTRTKKELRADRLEQEMTPGKRYDSTEIAAIAFDKDESDVTKSNRAYVTQLQTAAAIQSETNRGNRNQKLYYLPDDDGDGAGDTGKIGRGTRQQVTEETPA